MEYIRRFANRCRNLIGKSRFLKIPDWNTLSRVGRLRVLRTSYFWLVAVPLLAQWLSKVKREVDVELLGADFTIVFDLPFSWKVFYFSAVSFSIATTIYSWRCHDIIKDYNSFDDYKKDGESQLLLKMPLISQTKKSERHSQSSVLKTAEEHNLTAFLIQMCELRSKQSVPISRETINGITTKHELIELFLNDCDINSTRLSDAFQFVKGTVAQWNWYSRLFCLIFYGLGFVLLGWVFVRTFFFVIWFVTVR